MKKSDLQVLLIVLGIAFVVLSWNFIYSANNEKAETIKIENETVLQPEVDKLEALEANKEQYIADTATMKEESEAIVELFPAGILTEDEIMYYNNLELNSMNQAEIPSISMQVPTELPYTGTTQVEEYELTDDGIKMFESQTSLNFTTTYSGLKNMINYIYSEPGRKSINTISLSAGADGHLTGAMAVDFYYLSGTSALYQPENIPAVPLGKDNIFGVLDGTDESEAVEESEE